MSELHATLNPPLPNREVLGRSVLLGPQAFPDTIPAAGVAALNGFTPGQQLGNLINDDCNAPGVLSLQVLPNGVGLEDPNPTGTPIWPVSDTYYQNSAFVASAGASGRIVPHVRFGLRIKPGGKRPPYLRVLDLSAFDWWSGQIEGAEIELWALGITGCTIGAPNTWSLWASFTPKGDGQTASPASFLVNEMSGIVTGATECNIAVPPGAYRYEHHSNILTRTVTRVDWIIQNPAAADMILPVVTGHGAATFDHDGYVPPHAAYLRVTINGAAFAPVTPGDNVCWAAFECR